MDKTVVELFAGVGGFRVGLNKIDEINDKGEAVENGNFDFVWANQWEPSTKAQDAFDCYKKRFPHDNVSNEDITLVNKKNIPNHTLLCGGFPCQDYSVARSLKNEKGIEGKKGVLWWQINEILKEKEPPFVLLENVDRLLRSPSTQRGQAFGVMLRCFADLDYSVQWRVINAADYGLPQRRRRVFIFAYKNKTKYCKNINKILPIDVIFKEGIFAKKFPVITYDEKQKVREICINNYADLLDVSNNFQGNFDKAGYMHKGKIYTINVLPVIEKASSLKEIIQKNVEDIFFLTSEKKEKFKYLRGAKKVLRTRKIDGGQYYYSEGAMSENDSLDLPGRTMLTSEGTTNRSSHIIIDPEQNALRFLTPLECERLNQFPDNWTSSMSNRRRYFMMGNALVCGIIERLGSEIEAIIDMEE